VESWNRKLRMGMVGGGQGAFIGAVHRMAATLDQQVELVSGCFSRDPANTRETGRRLYLDPARCYDTFEQMAAAEAALPASERIDFVSIVTPTVSHFAIARRFLETGIHVVCDKPLTYSLDEAKALVRLVEETGLVLALTHNYTGHPLVRHARHLCSSGQVGAIRKVIVEYLQDFLAFPHEKHGQKQAMWRVDPAQVGIAGTLGEAGVHCVNLLEYVTGDRIAALCADRTTFLPDRTLEEDANLLLRLEGGGKGVLTVSQIATGEENNLRLRVYGSKAALLWEQENPNELHLYRYGQPRQVLTRGQAEYLSPATTAATRLPTGHPEGYLEAFATIYCGLVRAIRRHLEGRPMAAAEYDFPTVHDGLRGLEFTYRGVESCDRGSVWVKL
jgi:predicted dehydrogenase